MKKLLIANRGEIAIRVARAAAALGIASVAVFTREDASSLHVMRADEAQRLPGHGVRGYLDAEAMIRIAKASGCDAVHPGYGFLSENAQFARLCRESDVTFVGPEIDQLSLFGDKAQARALAQRCGVALAAGTPGVASLDEARAFFASLPQGEAAIIKAIAGGGGRGMRVVQNAAEIEEAYRRCQSEAMSAFGNGDVYVERLIRRARHIEVQIVGDGQGNISHLYERDCTLQRRHQKLIEIAPSLTLPAAVRERIFAAAVSMAREVKYKSLGTFEFLYEPTPPKGQSDFIFMEANPRLQVEHTVTEEVTGIDLVCTQLQIADGASLPDLGLTQDNIPAPRGFAMQLRLNMEQLTANGDVVPSAGRLQVFDPPSGPGIRVDTFGYAGYETSASFDSLLAKLIVRTPRKEPLLDTGYRTLREFRIGGVATNTSLLLNLLKHPLVIADDIHTRFVEENLDQLVASVDHKARFFEAAPAAATVATLDNDDLVAPAGSVSVRSPIHGCVVGLEVSEGDIVHAGDSIAIMEAMKAEMVVHAPESGRVGRIVVTPGQTVSAEAVLLFIETMELEKLEGVADEVIDLDHLRPDLQELRARLEGLTDAGRPNAVAKRRKLDQRTARENIEDLCDDGSFVEYGGLLLAAQRGRRSLDELIEVSPADGTVTGTATVNAELFPDADTRCVVMSYDYTVFAGTQGFMAHRKMDRMMELARNIRAPFVLFSEGGGGRPGDTDYMGPSGLDLRTFRHFGLMSGVAPLVGIAAGRCFAGNAALLGACHVIIATEDSTIGMAGPAMIEAGGLGSFTPEQVGPAGIQTPNGVIDVLVKDEAAAVAAAKKYLGYFQGKLASWTCADQRLLRRVIPENRLRVYDIRGVIELLADEGSVMELRRAFAKGMVTAFVRVEGAPIGVIANNPIHLGGAIDADGADKAARFIQLCDAFDIPILSLCDTPGFMVGPDAEKTATVRHFARMFLAGASADTPFLSLVVRKAYGLGAQAMAGGAFSTGLFSLSWPSGELGAMGIEGAVRLAYRKELEAIEDLADRQRAFERYVAQLYADGRALNAATYMEIDDVIDPAETRSRIASALRAAPKKPTQNSPKRPFVDSW